MAALAQLMGTLVHIQNQCVDPAEMKRKAEEEAALDDFARQKRKIREGIAEQRKLIKERDAMLAKKKGQSTADSVKLSSTIHSNLKQLKADTEALEQLQKDEAEKLGKKARKKKKPLDENDQARIDMREELVDLAWQHLDEVRKLEKGKGMRMAGADSDDSGEQIYVSELPELEGDEKFLLLKQQDEQINVKLYAIEDGVAVLKEMALSFGQELDVQAAMIRELDEKVDNANAQMDNLNKKLKDTLTQVRKGDKLCLDIICIVVILAIAGYLYNEFA